MKKQTSCWISLQFGGKWICENVESVFQEFKCYHRTKIVSEQKKYFEIYEPRFVNFQLPPRIYELIAYKNTKKFQ